MQDDESGFVYMRARYYEPGTGRFVSEDPDRQGAMWFAYCGCDPVNHVDSSGRMYDVLQSLWDAIVPLLRDFGIKATSGMLAKMVLKLGAAAVGQAFLMLGNSMLAVGNFLARIGAGLAETDGWAGQMAGAGLGWCGAQAVALGLETQELGMGLIYMDELGLPTPDDFGEGGGTGTGGFDGYGDNSGGQLN